MKMSNILKLSAMKKKQNTCSGNSSSLYISNKPPTKGGPCLFLIDPQVDFVTGSLAVGGADKDCERIAQFITNNLAVLAEIYVTLDTHMNHHIAHPSFWENARNENPMPFDKITYQQVEQGVWTPVDKSLIPWCKEYTRKLETQHRLSGVEAFTLTIWPPHCLIGTAGHNVEPGIMKALQAWEKVNKKPVHYIIKGNNSKTEHYSAFRAEVIVPDDPDTGFNKALFKDLTAHDKIYVAGEAASHCVNFSVRDLANEMNAENARNKIILLEEAMSPVYQCEADAQNFFKDMKNLGISVKKSNEILSAVGEGQLKPTTGTNKLI